MKETIDDLVDSKKEGFTDYCFKEIFEGSFSKVLSRIVACDLGVIGVGKYLNFTGDTLMAPLGFAVAFYSLYIGSIYASYKLSKRAP